MENKPVRQINEKTFMELFNFYSSQCITINQLSILKAACLNNSNKTPPAVKLLFCSILELIERDLALVFCFV